MNNNLIEIQDLALVFSKNGSKLNVIRNLNASINSGEFVSILGPSGCGKSSLLKLVGDLLKPTSGKISVRNKSPEKARNDREFGFVFQNPVLFNWRTVLENVLLPFEVFNHTSHSLDKEDVEHALNMIGMVGLQGFESTYPSQLSGGMQSRAAIARALSYKPSILLMDEPFGDLDELTRTRMNLELMRIWEATKSTVLFVTHSIVESVFLSDRVLVMGPRPSTIIKEVIIDIPRPRKLFIQETPEFNKYISLLKQAIGLE